MKIKNKDIKNKIAIFEEKEVKRTWYNEQWYFVINDVVNVLTQTTNVSDYIKKMRLRDRELGKGWGQIVTPLSVDTAGGKQRMKCANV